jgi:hypothetical protein
MKQGECIEPLPTACTRFCFAANVSAFLNPDWFAKLSNACPVKLIIGTECKKGLKPNLPNSQCCHCQCCDAAKVRMGQIWLYTRYESYQRKSLCTWLPTGIYHWKMVIWEFLEFGEVELVFPWIPSYQGLFFNFFHKSIGEFPSSKWQN